MSGSMASDQYNRVQILYNGEHQPYLYGAVHIIDGPLDSQYWETPFVVSKSTSRGGKIVYGTIIRTLQHISRQLDRVRSFQAKTQARLKQAGVAVSLDGSLLTSSPVADQILDEQEELIEDLLIILGSKVRILSEIFSHRLRDFVVPVYDKDDQAIESIELKEIANLLFHNRYFVVRDRFVHDLMSDEKFMSTIPQTGLKFDVREFLAETDRLIRSLTVRDLTVMLQEKVEELSASSSVKDIIFLHQNLLTLGGLTMDRDNPVVEGPLEVVLDRVRDREVDRWVSANPVHGETTLHFTVVYSSPGFYLEPELDDKRIRVTAQVNGQEESVTVGYQEFFAEVVDAFGEAKLYTPAATERSSKASEGRRNKGEGRRKRKGTGRGRRGLRKKRKR